MRKLTLRKLARDVCASVSENAPEILILAGITGFITTVGLAIDATPKALRIIEEERENRETDISKKDALKLTWKCYIPTVITGTISVGCILYAHSEHTKRQAALATAYALSESTLKDYQAKVKETVGKKKEQIIQDEIAKDQIEKHPVSSSEVIVTGKDKHLCYDALSSRYFESSVNKLEKAENTLNRRLRDEMWVSLNEFYWELDLPSAKIGDDLGWHIDDGGIELRLSTQLSENDEPCIVINYVVAPRYRPRY